MVLFKASANGLNCEVSLVAIRQLIDMFYEYFVQDFNVTYEASLCSWK